MSRLYALTATLWMNYSAMSPGERFMALSHVGIDFIILVFLAASIYVGMMKDPYAFAFWVPALGILLFFRMKQAKRRWKL